MQIHEAKHFLHRFATVSPRSQPLTNCAIETNRAQRLGLPVPPSRAGAWRGWKRARLAAGERGRGREATGTEPAAQNPPPRKAVPAALGPQPGA